MNIGDKVRVLDRKTWKLKERELDRDQIESYKKQSDNEHNSIIERDIPIGLSLANAALADLLPGEKVVLKDGILYGYYDAVSISPTQYHEQTIRSFIERTGWEVTTWHVQPSTRWHPEECWDSPVGTFPTIERAVESMIETIFKLKCSDYWTGKGEEAQAKAWAENEM